ncbi:hypothetical protein HELRODRAFT_175214 [Helobdella robusta]|uniref:DUF4795 domain-containing protein n=1 Tax=Helobdella robusta TaxID=6412 RepID=T1F909_HELRO|nr:hypothetical protein HELRODRAFT_175214 [Helobdella robusta]ESO01186.1 hypothetical protein HELRODRAFT_175214 [Helobdella robusta]
MAEVDGIGTATERLLCRVQKCEDLLCNMRQVVNKVYGCITANPMTRYESEHIWACLFNPEEMPNMSNEDDTGLTEMQLKTFHTQITKIDCEAKIIERSLVNVEAMKIDVKNLFSVVNELDDNKLDKCLLTSELAKKADKNLADGMVNQYCFQQTCEGLHSVINEILSRILENDKECHKIISYLTAKINTKADHEDFLTLKDQAENKLRCLARKLTTLHKYRTNNSLNNNIISSANAKVNANANNQMKAKGLKSPKLAPISLNNNADSNHATTSTRSSIVAAAVATLATNKATPDCDNRMKKKIKNKLVPIPRPLTANSDLKAGTSSQKRVSNNANNNNNSSVNVNKPSRCNSSSNIKTNRIVTANNGNHQNNNNNNNNNKDNSNKNDDDGSNNNNNNNDHNNNQAWPSDNNNNEDINDEDNEDDYGDDDGGDDNGDDSDKIHEYDDEENDDDDDDEDDDDCDADEEECKIADGERKCEQNLENKIYLENNNKEDDKIKNDKCDDDDVIIINSNNNNVTHYNNIDEDAYCITFNNNNDLMINNDIVNINIETNNIASANNETSNNVLATGLGNNMLATGLGNISLSNHILNNGNNSDGGDTVLDEEDMSLIAHLLDYQCYNNDELYDDFYDSLFNKSNQTFNNSNNDDVHIMDSADVEVDENLIRNESGNNAKTEQETKPTTEQQQQQKENNISQVEENFNSDSKTNINNGLNNENGADEKQRNTSYADNNLDNNLDKHRTRPITNMTPDELNIEILIQEAVKRTINGKLEALYKQYGADSSRNEAESSSNHHSNNIDAGSDDMHICEPDLNANIDPNANNDGDSDNLVASRDSNTNVCNNVDDVLSGYHSEMNDLTARYKQILAEYYSRTNMENNDDSNNNNSNENNNNNNGNDDIVMKLYKQFTNKLKYTKHPSDKEKEGGKNDKNDDKNDNNNEKCSLDKMMEDLNSISLGCDGKTCRCSKGCCN